MAAKLNDRASGRRTLKKSTTGWRGANLGSWRWHKHKKRNLNNWHLLAIVIQILAQSGTETAYLVFWHILLLTMITDSSGDGKRMSISIQKKRQPATLLTLSGDGRAHYLWNLSNCYKGNKRVAATPDLVLQFARRLHSLSSHVQSPRTVIDISRQRAMTIPPCET